MAQTVVLAGANIVLYVNNKKYKEVQSITLNVDYGETEIYGIDSLYAQEIAPTKVMIRGSIQGVRVKNSGGLQGVNMRTLFNDAAASPYISLRIQDRATQEDIVFIQQAKVTKETHSMQTKSTYKLSFEFVGVVPLFALDRS